MFVVITISVFTFLPCYKLQRQFPYAMEGLVHGVYEGSGNTSFFSW